MAPRALLFDLDGTVWDSYPWYARVLAAEDLMSESAAIRELRSGRSIVSLAKSCGLRLSRLKRYQEMLPLYPGVREALDELARRATPRAVVTNLPGRLVLPILEGLGLDHHFAAVIHAGNCHFRKPHPGPLNAALEQMKISVSNRVFYVGDMATDAEAADRAGLAFAWASYGYGDQCPSQASRVLRRFGEVLAL